LKADFSVNSAKICQKEVANQLAVWHIGGMTENSNSGGIGLSGLLTVAFVVLKLCKVISWSWWWVLAPTWITALVVVGLLVLVAICSKD